MFRFHVGPVKLMHPDETELGQSARDVFATDLACVILIEHDDGMTVGMGVLPDQFLLRG